MANNSVGKILLKTFLVIVLIAVIAGAIAGIKALQIKSMIEMGSKMGPPVQAVATAEVESFEWTVESNAIGTIEAVRGVMLSVDSPGVIASIDFESGQSVAAGDLLLTLDTQSEEAELASVVAAAELAEINLERSGTLLERNTISQSEFDVVNAEYKQAQAQVANIEARILKKRIVAPFDGVLGIRRVNLGQFINSGSEVVSLQSMDPIYATFYLPQQELAFLKTGLKVGVESDAYPARVFEGTVTAIAAEVDPQTRMIEVQAQLANPEGDLKVGMYVQVSLLHPEAREVQAVPATAVIYAPFGNTIYTVVPATEGEGFVAKQNFVELGERRGDYIEVLSGLDGEERVVISGGFKLYPFAPVKMNDERAPKASLSPNPEDA